MDDSIKRKGPAETFCVFENVAKNFPQLRPLGLRKKHPDALIDKPTAVVPTGDSLDIKEVKEEGVDCTQKH